MSLEDKWASLDKKLDGILRNQSYIIQKVLLMQNQLEQLSTAAPAKGDVPKPKEVFSTDNRQRDNPIYRKSTSAKGARGTSAQRARDTGGKGARGCNTKGARGHRKTYPKGSHAGAYYPS